MTDKRARSIILRPHEVRAAVAARLTMLWRLMKEQPTEHWCPREKRTVWRWAPSNEYDINLEHLNGSLCDKLSPFPVGTVLWGQETWKLVWKRGILVDPAIVYRADGAKYPLEHRTNGDWVSHGTCVFESYLRRAATTPPYRWRASSQMPFWACRRTLRYLEVVGVEYRQVQDIYEYEAQAQGVDKHNKRPEHKWDANLWAWVYTVAGNDTED